jgi:hypothetical protein
MPAKNSEKKLDSIKELQKNIFPILVINNPSLKPYIELFEYAPENIYQKPLGTLIGFFEIKEYSEQSAYVVNFLTSVLKKEYYTNPRRSVTESFDSALHKVNLALSEVAKHGNVQWIGKLHASICVLEKNAIHFTVAGNAKIFLNRKQTLTDIGEGLSSEENEPHPLKTFINVSSGRIEKEDRLIITCEDIFHILKLSDLNKNLQRLTKQQFVQFLKTALSNELEMIATIVTDFEEVKKKTAIKAFEESTDPLEEEVINVFSEKAFPGKIAAKKIEKESNLEDESTLQTDYTDKKTGHIYIQGGAPPDEISQAQHYLEIAMEKVSDAWQVSKNSFRRNYVLLKKQLKKKIEQSKIKAQLQRENFKEKKRLENERLEVIAEQERLKAAEIERLEFESQQVTQLEQNTEKTQPFIEKKKLAEVINLKEKKLPVKEEYVEDMIVNNIEEEVSEFQSIQEDNNTLEEASDHLSDHLFENMKVISKKTTSTVSSILGSLKNLKKPSADFLGKAAEKINFKELKTVPHLSKLRKLFHSMTSSQKRNAVLALIAIFVIPFFIAKWLNRPKPATIKDLSKVEITQTEKLSNEKNIKFINSNSKAISNSEINNVLFADGSVIASTKKSLIVSKDGKQNEYQFPAEVGQTVRMTYMADLSMVLILTDQNKVLSFTVNNSKFAQNNIDLASNSSARLIGTYLTYLYVLDPSSNQIVRYPRAEGGFGGKTNWLKETVSFDGVSDMTIDENIYVVQSNQIIRFFKGKKQALTLENSNTPIHFSRIYTGIDLTSLYVLDAQNSRLIQYDKTTGAIISQFYNEALKNGSALAVDEKNKTAYVVTNEGLISVALQ